MNSRHTVDDDTSDREVALISAAQSARRLEHANLVGLLVFAGTASISALLLFRGMGLRLGFPAMVVAGVSMVVFLTRFRRASRKAFEAEQELGAVLAERRSETKRFLAAEGETIVTQRPDRNAH